MFLTKLNGEWLEEVVTSTLNEFKKENREFSAYDVTKEIRSLLGQHIEVDHESVRPLVHDIMPQDLNYESSNDGSYIKYKPKLSNINRKYIDKNRKFWVGALVKSKTEFHNCYWQNKPRFVVDRTDYSTTYNAVWCQFDTSPLWSDANNLELFSGHFEGKEYLDGEEVDSSRITHVINNKQQIVKTIIRDMNKVALYGYKESKIKPRQKEFIVKFNKAGLHLPKELSSQLQNEITININGSILSLKKDKRGDLRLSNQRLNPNKYSQRINGLKLQIVNDSSLVGEPL